MTRKNKSVRVHHDEIVDLAGQGLPLSVIAERLDLIEGSLRVYVRRNGIHHVKNARRAERVERSTACSRNHDLVVEMAQSGATMKQIAEAVGTNQNRVREYLTRHGIERPVWRERPEGSHPMSRNTSGRLNAAWKGGRTYDKDGYVLVWMPDHPDADRHGRVREHRLVMERMIGRRLTPVEVVDHRNDVRDDNRPENLRLFSTNGEHLSATLTGRKSRASRGLPPSNRKPSGKGGRT